MQLYCSTNSRGKGRDSVLSHIKMTERGSQNIDRLFRSVFLDMKRYNLVETLGMSYKELTQLEFGHYQWLINEVRETKKIEDQMLENAKKQLVKGNSNKNPRQLSFDDILKNQNQ